MLYLGWRYLRLTSTPDGQQTQLPAEGRMVVSPFRLERVKDIPLILLILSKQN